MTHKHFGKSVPDNFLDKITPGDMAELLHAMTRAVREESIVVRITGSRSMGHILAIVTIMFPEDTFVTMENVIVFEGLRKSILVEFTDSGIIKCRVEWKLEIQSAVPIIPVAKQTQIAVANRHAYCYRWNGCMADMLQLIFIDEGMICPEPLRVACCGVLEPLVKASNGIDNQFDKTGLLGHYGAMKLLGPYPHERIDQVCQNLWRIPPGWARPTSSLKAAFDDLLLAFAEATPTASCTCQPENRCLPQLGWTNSHQRTKLRMCPRYRLWMAVGEAIGCGFGCLFVNAGSGATIVHPMNYLRSGPLPVVITALLDPKREPTTGRHGPGYREIIYGCIKRVCGSLGGIAVSWNSSTAYMAALQNTKLPNTMNALYILTEGQLIFNGRYHTILHAIGSTRPSEEKDIHQGTQPIIPSSIGEHSSLTMTIREGVDDLQLTTTIVVGGSIVHLDIEDIILASWELHEAEPCEHPVDTPLEPGHEGAVLTTSLASPSAIEGKIAIVQVSRNPVAQLFACVRDKRTLLQTTCCLNCAYEEAVRGKYRMIIVG